MATTELTRRAQPEHLPSWGVAVLESHHAADFVMEWRSHPFLKLVYALAGEGEVQFAGSSIPFTPGDLILVPSGTKNRVVDRPGRPASLYVLCLAPAALTFDDRLATELQTRPYAVRDTPQATVQSAFRRLIYQERRPQPDSLAMLIEALRLIRLVAHPTPADSDTAAMSRYVRYLDEHFYEATTLDAAADRLGVSRRAFTKRFRELTGKTWLDYVRGRAIEHAMALLREDEASIASIAFECGFDDLSSFYRAFKRHAGAPPAAWRKQANGREDL